MGPGLINQAKLKVKKNKYVCVSARDRWGWSEVCAAQACDGIVVMTYISQQAIILYVF